MIFKSRLTASQKSLWIEWKLNPNSTAYNCPFAFKLSGSLDRSILEKSLQILIQRHASFRSYFIEEDSQPRLIIDDRIKLQLNYIDLTERNLGDAEIEEIIYHHANQLFNLAIPPLFNFSLFKNVNDEYYFIFNFHHILIDGHSFSAFLQELSLLYRGGIENISLNLSPVTSTLDILLAEEDKYFNSIQYQNDISYWQEFLRNSNFKTNFPSQFISKKDNNCINLYFSIPLELKSALKAIAAKENATLFITLLACFNVLIYRYTLEDDITISYPVNLRNSKSSYSNLVHYSVNPHFSRTKINAESTFISIMNDIKRTRQNSKIHQTLPNFNIINGLRASGATDIQGLANITFGASHLGYNDLSLLNTHITILTTGVKDLQNDFSMTYQETEKDIACKIWCSSQKFDLQFIKNLSENFLTLIQEIINNPFKLITRVPLLNQREKSNILLYTQGEKTLIMTKKLW